MNYLRGTDGVCSINDPVKTLDDDTTSYNFWFIFTITLIYYITLTLTLFNEKRNIKIL